MESSSLRISSARKETSVKVDILSRQALVSPVFIGSENHQTKARYTKIHVPGSEPNPTSGNSHNSDIYKEFETPFNHLSQELLTNNENINEPLSELTPKRRKLLELNYCYNPLKFSELIREDLIDETKVREMSMVLTSFLLELDDWIGRVNGSLSLMNTDRLLLDEAKALYDEYKLMTNGKIRVKAAEELLNEINKCESYSSKIRENLPFLYDKDQKYSNDEDEKKIEIDMIELLIKEGYEYHFIVKEFVQLQNIFSNVSTLVHLLNNTILESNMNDCVSLIEECDKSVVKVPNLYKLKSHIIDISWLNDAVRYSSKSVNYALVGDLLNKTPKELLNHPLYHKLQTKYNNALHWIDKLNSPKFALIKNDAKLNTHSGNKRNSEDSKSSRIAATLSATFYTNFQEYTETNISPGDTVQAKDDTLVKRTNPQCKPEDIEQLYMEYQKIDLIIPTFKAIDQVYQMWRRFKRHHKRVESFLKSENNINCTTECLLLLQCAKSLAEYVDLSHILGPLEVGVEASLVYERKCRKILNDFNTWDLTNECNRLKCNDWNSLLSFRRSNKVTTSDLNHVITLFKLITPTASGEGTKVHGDTTAETASNSISGHSENHSEPLDKPEFSESDSTKSHEKVGQSKTSVDDQEDANIKTVEYSITPKPITFDVLDSLVDEFDLLSVKNWQLYRLLRDVYDLGLDLRAKVSSAIRNVKEGVKTDPILANLILTSLQVLKYGAVLNVEVELYRALKYCYWVKQLYVNILKYLHETEGGKSQHSDAIVKLAGDDNIKLFYDLVDDKKKIGSFISSDYKTDDFILEILSYTELEFIEKSNTTQNPCTFVRKINSP